MESMNTRLDRDDDKGALRGDSRSAPDSLGNRVAAHEGPEEIASFQIVNGIKGIFGKAAWSANSGLQLIRPDLQRQQQVDARSKQDGAFIQQAQQLANLATWNAQMTTVGGVRMTNAEAQDARKHIIDNDDYYAERAVKEGRIQASEKDEYKATIRRVYELQDREGRGIATEAEKEESERLRESRMGREVENDAGRVHLEHSQTYKNDSVSTDRNVDESLSRLSAAPVGESLFQATPRLSAQFEQATQGPITPENENLPQQPAPKVAAMGLGI